MVEDRKVGVATDFSKSSNSALKWAIENMADKGDTFYIIHVMSDGSRTNIWAKSGSPLIPLSILRQPEAMSNYGVQTDPEVLDMLDAAAGQKEVNFVAKLYWGEARQKLIDSIEDLKLDSLVMGSRGRGSIKRILMGSVSNFLMIHATCPVAIVRDSSKSK
ncbi:universal stress protein PHOS34-like [Lotus japonicus]|uniref:UspA domain-containing protein n=1 Tax=Lotus japonicus TaxID=34305 RepID=I3SBV4_LOTJA|nr:universal stress protein PHOS34-like [Lotus japonicus]AFK37746.1 unknown [Lotus japonicus]